MNLVRASLKYKQVTLTVLLIVFIIGVYSLLTMPRREDPKITSPIGLLVSYFPGANAIQVEDQVTHPIEELLFQNAEVCKEKTKSISRDGISLVYVWINEDVTNPDVFWNKLRNQLLLIKQTKLPLEVVGPFVNSDFGDTEALLISIESDQVSNAQLKEYALMLENKIRSLPESSKIKRIGEQKQELTIQFNFQKLSQYDISLEQILQILKTQNVIFASGSITTDKYEIPIHTNGFYTNEEQIKNQIVATSSSGAVVRLRDIATITREYAKPESIIRVNGNNAIIVGVQMHEGNNIVEFGKKVDDILTQLKKEVPSFVEITIISNQPELVNHNVTHFLQEFLIAIIAVIIVVLLLLPFRIATVAATAIPMTIALTFAILHIFHIELHQVSLASLIVVLGMVVDDAIVVADNYVELLDKGISRWTAAWQSAYELIIPILTATITIIAAFLPIILLTGPIGEFIHDLPITVTVALSSSFVVAMFLTPILCFVFITKGLKEDLENDTKHHKKSILIHMQNIYNKALEWCVEYPKTIIIVTIMSIAIAVLLFVYGVGHKFFPEAERNQFFIELWMPMGTQIEYTNACIKRVEKVIKNDKRITSYATFVGMSAPRVYYNVSPEFPLTNYAQILINTQSNKATIDLAHELQSYIDTLVPEGKIYVKQMQQGQALDAPVEVNIYGDNLLHIKMLADTIKTIMKTSKGVGEIHNNFKEDVLGYTIVTNSEAARLGFTTQSIAQLIYLSSNGYSATKMFEGIREVAITLKTQNNKQATVDDLLNLYVQSPITKKNVPLRQIASIQPQWFPGQIIHKNGIRCMTIGCDMAPNYLAADVLKELKPKIETLQMPIGYTYTYGGEQANKTEVFSKMVIALAISLVIIFLILLFQFKNIKETSIIMLTIPFSLFGALAGLIITNNTFGFTAFMGIISLSGIVVRNAIILIDYIHVLLSEGYDIKTATIEAAKRRMRPIFLTAMAAAIGVVPMIISGSQLWSPLASVIAFGVTWSMITALLTIPVIYYKSLRKQETINYEE
ncbi:MAG TPA: efflux RND transporter permease subunit [Bacteroidales bacterium]|nr:efflux RND transporter permease subunit [Bacteroidales bacterium]